MDSSTYSLNSPTVSQTAAQRNFYQWVLKWINSVHTEFNIEEPRDDENRTKPDVPTLASFLQEIGFKLVSFEKYNDAHVPNNDENDTKSASKSGVLKIAIDCSTSNMRAILELEDIACLCPDPDDAKDASFWSISGAGLIGSTEKSGSGSQALRSGNGSSTCPSKPILQSQTTWDVDIETGSLDGEPRSTPPKPTTSPSTDIDLLTSMGQVSLQDEVGSPQIATDYIMGAQLHLEKALKALSRKKSIISKHLSPNQGCSMPDNDGASVKSAPEIISTAVAINPYKSLQSCTTDSSRSLSKLSNAIPNFEHAMIKLRARRSIQPTRSKSYAVKSINLEQESVKIRRRFFYIPSSTSSSFSLPLKPYYAGQTFMGETNNVPSESDFFHRTCLQARKIISPEPQVGATQNLKTLNTTNAGTSSMIRPPTKIPKFIPMKIKPTQASTIGTGIAKKSRMSMPK